MNECLVETRGLTKHYRQKKAVTAANLHIERGDIYGFLGPNGAGKTTTLRMLLGLIRPSQGHIRIFGKDLRKEKLAILRKVGSLVEYPSYYGHLTAYENLEAIRRILDVPKSRIDEVLGIVRLTKEARRPVKGFSLGMKQRLGIASSLLGSPELLILDEPTNGLDPSGILEMRELIKSMPHEYGVTVMISSHLLSEMDQMATRVGIIREGTMIFEDSIHALRQKAVGRIRLAVNEPGRAAAFLQDAGLFAEYHGSSLYLEQSPNEQVASVVNQLVHAGHSIYRVEEDKKSLEDIFLDLTGGEQSL